MNKLAVITSRFPYPLDKGDKLRAYHQIKELSNHQEITLFCLTDERVTQNQLTELEKFCKTIHVYRLTRLQIILNLIKTIFSRKPLQVGYFFSKKYHKSIHDKIRDLKPDHIYCQLVRCAEYVKNEFDIPKTIDYMDTLSKGMERRIPSSPFYIRPLLKMEANRLKNYESIMFDYFDKHTIISHQDQELIFLEPSEKIVVIPNGIDINYFKSKKKEKTYNLLFNGNMQYEPNVVSAIYIAKKILPIIHKTHPHVTLLISGTSPTKEVLSLQNDHVTVSGWLEDIRDAYNSAELFIAPMQIGTGLQNKLLEAMAMELPCITSKLANNALSAKPGKEILIGANEEEYASLVIELLENEEKSNEIAHNGFKYVTHTFNWTTSTKKLNSLMHSTLIQQ